MEMKILLVLIPHITLVIILPNVHPVNCNDTRKPAIDGGAKNLKQAETFEVLSELQREPIPKIGIHELQPIDFAQQKRLNKRSTHDFESTIKCSDVNISGKPQVQVVKDLNHNKYTFFFKPQRDFQRLIFNMKIDNNWDTKDPYYSDRVATIYKYDLRDEPKDTWLNITVEHYVHEVPFGITSFGRDKLALRVTLRDLTHTLITPRPWTTHTYKGFKISVDGGADFLFDCASETLPPPNPVSGVNKPLVLGGILGTCFLLVIVGSILCLVFRQQRRQPYDQGPPVPDLPASLLLGTNKVNKCPDVDHIYEEFDEDTLARLRQKMNPSNLSKCSDDLKGSSSPAVKASSPAAENIYATPRKVQLRSHLNQEAPSAEGKKGATGPDGIYMNEINMSIVEEKVKFSSRDSVPESHYVEMHGILTRSSVDMGN